MNKMQAQVNRMNRLVVGTKQPVETLVRLIKEECKELTDALEAGDEVGIADGACDSIVVILGAIYHTLNVDLEPIFNEVNRTNMMKEGGPIREDGKRLKPPGWEEPRIALFLDELRHQCVRCRGTGREWDNGDTTECSRCNGTRRDPDAPPRLAQGQVLIDVLSAIQHALGCGQTSICATCFPRAPGAAKKNDHV